MTGRKTTKLIREGQYVAEVDIQLVELDDAWSPYLSLDDAYRLDDIRGALRRGDIHAAAKLGRVFTLSPVTA
jgi:hypothetical protein